MGGLGGHGDDGDGASWDEHHADVEGWVRWLITARAAMDGHDADVTGGLWASHFCNTCLSARKGLRQCCSRRMTMAVLPRACEPVPRGIPSVQDLYQCSRWTARHLVVKRQQSCWGSFGVVSLASGTSHPPSPSP